MTLILVPPGRGKWRTTTVSIVGDRTAPLFFRVGQRIELGGITFRVSRILP